MIVVESLETRMPRQQVHQESPWWPLTSIPIHLFGVNHRYDRLRLDDPAGMQA
jgi:hypothetical protein